MKPHRFDPFSLVLGLATALFGAMLLFGDPDIEDLRPSHLWPFPVLVVGLLCTLYGVRRLMEAAQREREAADVPEDEPPSDQAETASIQN
jgi:hypothetical protein